MASDRLSLHISLEDKEYISFFLCDFKEKNGKTSPTKSDSSFNSEETISSAKTKDYEKILNVAEISLKNKLFPTDQSGAFLNDLKENFNSGNKFKRYYQSLKSGKTSLNDIQCIIYKCHEREPMPEQDVKTKISLNDKQQIFDQNGEKRLEIVHETENVKIVGKKDKSMQFSPSKSNNQNQPQISSDESLFDDSINSTESFRNSESGFHINQYYNIVNNYLCRKSIKKNHGLRRKKIRKIVFKTQNPLKTRYFKKIIHTTNKNDITKENNLMISSVKKLEQPHNQINEEND